MADGGARGRVTTGDNDSEQQWHSAQLLRCLALGVFYITRNEWTNGLTGQVWPLLGPTLWFNLIASFPVILFEILLRPFLLTVLYAFCPSSFLCAPCLHSVLCLVNVMPSITCSSSLWVVWREAVLQPLHKKTFITGQILPFLQHTSVLCMWVNNPASGPCVYVCGYLFG